MLKKNYKNCESYLIQKVNMMSDSFFLMVIKINFNLFFNFLTASIYGCAVSL